MNNFCISRSMKAVLVTVIWCLGLVAGQQNMPAVLLKQAADSILQAPFMQHLTQYDINNQVLSRIEIPSPEDLVIRRLQGELALRIDDNWQSLNDPQRWVIMQTKDPAKQILKSFEKIKTKAAELEEKINVEAVDTALNELDLSSEDMGDWVRFWDKLRKNVGQIANMYQNYFKGYIEKPKAVNNNTLVEFATSATQTSVPDRSLQNMLDMFHTTVIPMETTDKSLFPFL